MKSRILTFDFARGWAISFVVMLHGIVVHAMNGTQAATATLPLWVRILSIPFIILGSWASVFSLISGASLAYSSIRQITQTEIDLRKRLQNSLIRGLILLGFHFIYVYFFINPLLNIFDEPQLSLFIGSIRNQQWTIPSPTILFVASALSMLAFTDIFVSVTLYFLYRKKGGEKTKRNIIVLLCLGSIFVLIAPVLQHYLTPIMLESYQKGHYFITFILVWLVGRYHCIFPYVGFGFFGAVLGLELALNFNFKVIGGTGYGIGVTSLIISIISMIIQGLPSLTVPIHPFSYYMLNLGLEFCLFTFVMSRFEFHPNRKQYARWSISLRRWGLVSLTAFLLEGIIANLLILLLRAIFGDIMSNPAFIIFVFAPILVILWVQALKWWQLHDFKYSIEWWIAKASHRHQKENLLHVSEYLLNPAGLTIEHGKIVPLQENIKNESQDQNKSMNNDY
jgi:hypothetical protein